MHDSTQALIVDGDARTVLLIVRALSEQGMVVGAALNAADGLAEAARDDYDIVLTGGNLPDAEGFDFAEQVLDVLPNTRRVLIGADPETAGRRVFIPRPSDADSALDAVDGMFTALAEAEANARRARTGRERLRDLTGWRKVARFATNAGLFLIGPFVALSYMLALPFVGIYSFLKTTLSGWQQKDGPRAS